MSVKADRLAALADLTAPPRRIAPLGNAFSRAATTQALVHENAPFARRKFNPYVRTHAPSRMVAFGSFFAL